MNTNKHPAIVIGGGSENGLGIARNLGARGIDVYCVTSDPQEHSFHSKYCCGYKLLPNVERDAEILGQFLHSFQKHIQCPGVLFPTTDEAVLTLAAISDDLEGYVTYNPKIDVAETCVDKSKFYQSLERHAIPHPRTLYMTDIDSHTIEAQLGFPVYIKPAMSLQFNRIFNRKGFVAHNFQELTQRVHLAQKQGLRILIQEIIPGPPHNGYSLRGYIDKDSRLMAIMATQKLQQPDLFSNIAIKRSIPLHHLSRAKDMLVEYLQRIGYQGLFHSEWKRDARDNTVKLIEINARCSGGNYFGVACGLNHVLLAYLDCVNERIEPLRDYMIDVHQINILRSLSILVNKSLQRQLNYQDLRPYFRKKLAHLFAVDDPLPFFETLTRIIGRRAPGTFLRKLSRRS